MSFKSLPLKSAPIQVNSAVCHCERATAAVTIMNRLQVSGPALKMGIQYDANSETMHLSWKLNPPLKIWVFKVYCQEKKKQTPQQ